MAAACLTVTCAGPTISLRPGAPQPSATAPMPELWSEPTDLAQRNLLWGSGRPSDQPSTMVQYKVLRLDETGYSAGYDVIDPDGRLWDIKVGKEAQSEVVLSRILWALGYHQPPTYYLAGWQLVGTWKFEGDPARFRLESDYESEGEWKWLENPFSGSRPMNGLIALNVLLGNWDFKTSNNRVYRFRDAGGVSARRYVVQDLGASLGKPSPIPIPIGSRNDIEDFEEFTLVKEVRGSEVWLNYLGPHGDIVEPLHTADVIWACELMNRLGDSQLSDAFESAGYAPELRDRFIRKIRAKIREGLALKSIAGAAWGERQ
jgi:hypothetical protein